jgi:hypothetical protein
MQIQLAAESHVPCFQERVGTCQPGYMIPVRLPWRLRARPSATLHEIQVRPCHFWRGKLVFKMLTRTTHRSSTGNLLAIGGERSHWFAIACIETLCTDMLWS